MKNNFFYLGIFIFGWINIPQVFAGEGCVFDEGYFSHNTYKSDKNIKSFIWENNNQIAKLLTTEGSIISVQHWDCRHLGVMAVLLLDSVEMESDSVILKKIDELITIFVRKQDKDGVSKSARNMQCLQKVECKKNIPIQGYSEFYVETTRQRDSMTITLKYYMN